jgi:CBS domain containing-hemolysin-like protein
VLGLAIAVLFIALNGFFVAAEFALVKVRATQLHSRVRKGEKRAIVASAVISRLDRYLSVTQFGITLASLGLGWIGEPAAAHLVEHVVSGAGAYVPPRVLEIGIVVVAFGALTFAHVLFGELVPKLVAIQRSEKTALFVAGPLKIIYFTFRPLLWTLERATRVILHSAGLKSDVASEGMLSEDEILGVLAADAARSTTGTAKRELLERVLRFSQRTARHAMVPRVDVAYLPIDTKWADALAYLQEQRFTRVLLSKERSLDEIAGYLYAKDFLLAGQDAQPNLWGVRRDVLFVPESQTLMDVLREMQRAHTPIAVVVDEYGGTSGIITMEDLLEEIVGEIHDEFDEEPARIVALVGHPNEWDVDARATMEELRAVGVHVEAVDWGEPIGAYVLERLGRLPRKGDKVPLGDVAIAEVTKLSRRRVTQLRVRLQANPEKKSGADVNSDAAPRSSVASIRPSGKASIR